MKVIYDNEKNAYFIELENFESPLFVNTDDIIKVREYFIKHMTFLFNDAVNEQLNASKEKFARLFGNDTDIAEVVNEYYNNGLRDGFNRAKKVYNIKD